MDLSSTITTTEWLLNSQHHAKKKQDRIFVLKSKNLNKHYLQGVEHNSRAASSPDSTVIYFVQQQLLKRLEVRWWRCCLRAHVAYLVKRFNLKFVFYKHVPQFCFCSPIWKENAVFSNISITINIIFQRWMNVIFHKLHTKLTMWYFS